MASYQQIQRDPASNGLFNNRIETLESLRNHLNTSKGTAFIALDTEHFPVESEDDRVLHQVGLAFIKSISEEPPAQSPTRLQDFFAHSQAEVLTLNVNICDKTRDDIIRIRGGIPSRRPCRFGRERQVQQQDLEACIVQFLQSCNAATNTTNLVLVGFGMAAEWTHLVRDFPRMIPYLSSWVDLRDVGKDIAPIGFLPGLTTMLQIFGFFWKDLKPGRRGGIDSECGIADNAADDAVATLALAQALLRPANQEKLRFRQACGQIARIFTIKKGHHRIPHPAQFPFAAFVEFQGHPLPRPINSGMGLARMFFDFAPSSAGTLSSETAYLTFTGQSELDKFVQAVDGLVLSTGEVLSTRHFDNHSQEEDGEQKAKQALREEKRLARAAQDEVDDLGGLFD